MTTWRCSLELPKDQPISSFPSQHEHLPDPYISGQQPKVLSKACSLYCCDIKVRMKASYSLGRTYSTMIETPLSWQLARFQEAAVAQHQQENTPLKRTNTSGLCTPSRYSLSVYRWQFIEVFQDVSSPTRPYHSVHWCLHLRTNAICKQRFGRVPSCASTTARRPAQNSQPW